MRYRIIAEDRLAELLKEELLLNAVVQRYDDDFNDIAEDYLNYMSNEEYYDIFHKSDEELTNIFPIA